MKNQFFIEKDGTSFIKCEPEPMFLEIRTPCLVRFIQDNTPMGKYNYHLGVAKHIMLCEEIALGRVWLTERGTFEHYSRLEIVAKSCPEGSAEWALLKMIEGDKIQRKGTIYWLEDDSVMCSVNNQPIDVVKMYLYPISKWINETFKDCDWKIYKEPKSDLTIGQWYKDYGLYYQCSVVCDTYAKLRMAGHGENACIVDCEDYYKLEPASLEPDFSDAKVGDDCYDVVDGHCTIAEVRTLWGKTVVNTSRGVGYTDDGKEGERAVNPTLFHSAAQAAAYFSEAALKESKGK